MQEKKILPFNQSEKNEIYLLDPYELRAKGLNQKLNPQELARVFLHLCKRRGFLSNRKTTFLELFKNPTIKKELAKEAENEEKKEAEKELRKLQIQEEKKIQNKHNSDEKDEKKTLANIIFLKTNIEESKSQTLGEYLCKKEKKRSLNTDREMYEKEFELFWDKQQEYHKELLDKNLKSLFFVFFITIFFSSCICNLVLFASFFSSFSASFASSFLIVGFLKSSRKVVLRLLKKPLLLQRCKNTLASS